MSAAVSCSMMQDDDGYDDVDDDDHDNVGDDDHVDDHIEVELLVS